mmetsp:Transcript_25573/g.82478  ORF Transcript_25573/g.82478 Transcript_25573/m.82478 type:complete len:418 (+) Transcript_25573:183-1436(+)
MHAARRHTDNVLGELHSSDLGELLQAHSAVRNDLLALQHVKADVARLPPDVVLAQQEVGLVFHLEIHAALVHEPCHLRQIFAQDLCDLRHLHAVALQFLDALHGLLAQCMLDLGGLLGGASDLAAANPHPGLDLARLPELSRQAAALELASQERHQGRVLANGRRLRARCEQRGQPWTFLLAHFLQDFIRLLLLLIFLPLLPLLGPEVAGRVRPWRRGVLLGTAARTQGRRGRTAFHRPKLHHFSGSYAAGPAAPCGAVGRRVRREVEELGRQHELAATGGRPCCRSTTAAALAAGRLGGVAAGSLQGHLASTRAGLHQIGYAPSVGAANGALLARKIGVHHREVHDLTLVKHQEVEVLLPRDVHRVVLHAASGRVLIVHGELHLDGRRAHKKRTSDRPSGGPQRRPTSSLHTGAGL